jgi:hypothetical protein
MEGRSSWVKTEKDFAPLLSVPLGDILSKAAELSGRDHEHFVQKDPYAGLAANRPIRAFSALTLAGKKGEYPEAPWTTFLNPEARKNDKPKFSALIAGRVAKIPEPALASLVYSVSEWFLKSGEILIKEYPREFEGLWSALISTLRKNEDIGESSVIRGNKEPDWATEALNAPIGKLAQVVMNDPRKGSKELRGGFPTSWIKRVDELLSMRGDRRRHALVMFAFNLVWFYSIDPGGTESRFLAAIDSDADDKAAVWSGFFWGVGASGISENLFARLKPRLIELAKEKALSKRTHTQMLSSIVLLGWGRLTVATGERSLTDNEARDAILNSDEEFRLHVLWQLERWSETDKGWRDQVAKFLRDVWPRQKAAKTPKVSARLCELTFSNLEVFPEVADVVLNLLTKADGEHLTMHDLTSSNALVERYPERTLALLYAVLPNDTSGWPYLINEVLDRICTSDPVLRTDERLIELKRRWNSR